MTSKRSYSMHSDFDLRHSVESFKSNANKSAYYILIGYMNGISSDKGWVLWKESTLINICWHLDRRSVKKFMDSEEVKNKLIFGTDKIGDLWCTHSRTQSDLIEYFSKSKSVNFEPKNVQLCTESVQSLCKPVQSLCNYVQSTTHNPMNNKDSKIQSKVKESKVKEDIYSLAQAQKTEDFETYKNHDFFGETEVQKKDLDEAYDAICHGEENQKTQYVFEPSKLRNAPKSMQEVEEAYKSIVSIIESKGGKSNTSLEFWFKHWEFKNWTDDNKKPIDWKSKLSYNAEQKFFDKVEKKEEKSQTQKKGWVQQPTKMEQESERIKTVVYNNLKAKQEDQEMEELQEVIQEIKPKQVLKIETPKEFDINDEGFWNDTKRYF